MPVGHGYQAHAAMPGTKFEVFEAGHFPFRSHPERFVAVLEEFLAGTRPSRWGVEDRHDLLREGRPAAVRRTEAPEYRRELQSASERSAT
ncbi:MAG: hypothetical protein ABI345_10040 [Jatrophihabitans sp.]